MSLAAVFAYEVELAAAEAFEAVYGSRNEAAQRLWLSERTLGRFEAR